MSLPYPTRSHQVGLIPSKAPPSLQPTLPLLLQPPDFLPPSFVHSLTHSVTLPSSLASSSFPPGALAPSLFLLALSLPCLLHHTKQVDLQRIFIPTVTIIKLLPCLRSGTRRLTNHARMVVDGPGRSCFRPLAPQPRVGFWLPSELLCPHQQLPAGELAGCRCRGVVAGATSPRESASSEKSRDSVPRNERQTWSPRSLQTHPAQCRHAPNHD